MYPNNVSYCIILYGLKVGVENHGLKQVVIAVVNMKCEVKPKFNFNFLHFLGNHAAAVEMTSEASQMETSARSVQGCSDSNKKACHICGKVLASLRNLDNHMKKVHGQVIPTV